MKVKIHGKIYDGEIADKVAAFYKKFYDTIHNYDIDKAIRLINDFLNDTAKIKEKEIRKMRSDLAKMKKLLIFSKKFRTIRYKTILSLKRNLPPPETMISE